MSQIDEKILDKLKEAAARFVSLKKRLLLHLNLVAGSIRLFAPCQVTAEK